MQPHSDTGIPERVFYVALVGGLLAIGFWFDRMASEVRPPPPAMEARDLMRPIEVVKGLLLERRQSESSEPAPKSSGPVGERSDLVAFHRSPSI